MNTRSCQITLNRFNAHSVLGIDLTGGLRGIVMKPSHVWVSIYNFKEVAVRFYMYYDESTIDDPIRLPIG